MGLNLRIDPKVTITGVLDFQGAEYVQFPNQSDLTGNKTIKFNIWLDNDSGYALFTSALSLGGTATDHFDVVIEGSDMIFISSSSGGGTQNRSCSISGLDSQILSVEVSKGTTTINSVKFNGISQSLTNSYRSQNIGSYDYIGRSVSGFLKDATIWNIEVVGEFKVLGYPSGNLDPAWLDKIGSNDGGVNGSPGTRNIEGTVIGEISGSKLQISNALLSNLIIEPPPPPITKTIYAGTSSTGLVLSSEVIVDSGAIPDVVFSSLGTEGLGNITKMSQYTNNDIVHDIYGTDTGYFVNRTLDTSIQVSNYSITSLISPYSSIIYIGDAQGGNYESSDEGASWTSRGFALGTNQVNEIFRHIFNQ